LLEDREASHPSKGLPIRLAIGWSLPCVDLPRDTAFFGNDKTYGQQVAPWRKAFEKLYQNRSPLLARQRPNSQPIDPEDMRQRFEENIAAIPDAARVVLEAFINALAGDKDTASAVAELEWESDGVHLIFEKPREKLKGLADSTIHFFQHVCSEHDALDAQWLKHLEDLKAREKRSDWNEDDEVFFNLHRRYLEQDAKLCRAGRRSSMASPSSAWTSSTALLSAEQHLIVGSCAMPKGERIPADHRQQGPQGVARAVQSRRRGRISPRCTGA
jgi:S-DNA-T family DNA segregation ATPase FtsK/SpoIIIE